MKPLVSPHVVACLMIGSMASLSAQNLPGSLVFSEVAKAEDEDSASAAALEIDAPISVEVPAVPRAKGNPPASVPVYAAQDARTLDTQVAPQRNVEAVVDLNVLTRPSPYRRVAVSAAGGAPDQVAAGSLQAGLAMISAAYRESGKVAKGEGCGGVSLSIEQRVKMDPAKVLEVVQSEVASNPGCSCEIVKAAIKASEADVALVASIVECAVTTAPENMRIVSQCAIASMPEAISEVQAVLARLDPNSGDAGESAKSAKSAKGEKAAMVPDLPNPLDRPPFPPSYPPIIVPPPVTQTNPCPQWGSYE